MPNVTASAKAVPSYSKVGIHVKENFDIVCQTGLDEVYKREMQRPTEGGQFFRAVSMPKATLKMQSYYGMGIIGQNRDTEEMPLDEMGLGFGWELTSNIYRGEIAIEKQLQEDELYGTIKNLQSGLVEGMKMAREFVMADGLNRGFGDSGAPFTCEDGMYLIDSDRPNAYAPAGTWSNLEADGAITPAMLFQVQLNFAQNKDERGFLAPLKLKKIIIRPSEEQKIWEILKTDRGLYTDQHTMNYQYGRFEYIVYNYLTTAAVYFLAEDTKSQKNELVFGTRTKDMMDTYKKGNPHVTYQSIRSRFGIGCGRPYIWRGMKLV